MGVYIKGFPLPNNCGACPLRLAWCRERIYMVTRPERCPLVPVPPHGRLIDADALLNRDADYEYPLFDTDGSWDCVVPCYDRETIKSAPTFLEAEDGET